MNDRETLFLLSNARSNIGQSMALLQSIAPYYPAVARRKLRRMESLAARQIRLENRVSEAQAQCQYDPQLGAFIVPVIMGGMALLGVGGWVFKHHEDTALERYKLESIAKCIEENIKTGMDRAEASRICGELFTGKSIANVFTELSKTIMLASIAITGIYIFIKWRK